MKITELLWPEICPFCGRASRQGICGECRRETKKLLITGPRCMKCGKPVSYEEQEYCYDCTHRKRSFDGGMGVWLHKRPVSTSIYRFKYHNQRAFARLYAKEMAEAAGPRIIRWRPEVILPVPLHPRRRRKRGYNQAGLLARELGLLWGIPAPDDWIKRVRDTNPLKELDPEGRRRNMRRAFALTASAGRVRRVLVVDDIYTTGATMDAAACLLKEAGIQKVYFLTISIGQGY